MVTAVIQARMGSSRLRGKVMLEISGNPILYYVIKRVLSAKKIEDVIVATTNKNEDDIIVEFCNKIGIEIYRGSESDVLDRYYKCAKKFDLEDIVRITADCPLIDPKIIDSVVDVYMNGGYDYVTNTMPPTFPDGMDVEVFSFNTLSTAWENAKWTSEREHVTLFIRERPHLFKIKNVENEEDLSYIRLTLDQIEDYKLIKSIYEYFYPEVIFHLDEMLEMLNKKPHLLDINKKIPRDEGSFKSIIEDRLIEVGKCTYEIIRGRRSIRRFLQVPVPFSSLMRCVNAARLAPSSGNLQPLEYLIVIEEDRRKVIFENVEWAKYLNRKSKPKEDEQPMAYIIVLHNRDVESRGVDYDVGLACGNMVLTAQEDGISSCIIGSINRREISEALKIPEKYDIKLIVALGYAKEEAIYVEKDDYRYWRENDIHYVPKKPLTKIMHINEV